MSSNSITTSKAFIQKTVTTNKSSSLLSSLSTSSPTKESIVKSSIKKTKQYLQYANSYSGTYGLLLENTVTSTYKPAPISLLPNIIPSTNFNQGKDISKDINVLMDTIAHDYEFIYDSLLGVDEEFTGKLLDIFYKIYMEDDGGNKVYNTKRNAAKYADSLGILRSDYMLTPIITNNDDDDDDDNIKYSLKQIECNTIASSFAGLSVQISKFHQFLCSRFMKEGNTNNWMYNFLKYNRDTIMGSNTNSASKELGYIPDNNTIQNVAYSINVTHERYISRYKVKNKDNVIIIFIIQENESNTIDQRILEYTLYNNHKIQVLRMSLLQAYETLYVNDDSDGTLMFKDHDDDGDDEKEVSLLYFRAGYTPDDYPTSKHWEARTFLELTKCSKCPNLPYHLSGTKKIQQLISKPDILSKFVSEKDKCNDILSIFANLYTLNEDDATIRDKDAVLDAMTEDGCKNYVLKPQREGGGNNYYDNEMIDILKSYTTLEDDNDNNSLTLSSKLKEYILMERLFPPKQLSILLRNGQFENDESNVCNDSISELGIFGMIVSDNSKKDNDDSEGKKKEHASNILHNEYGGYLLRTKYFNVNEGGVASGFATLSTPFLCD